MLTFFCIINNFHLPDFSHVYLQDKYLGVKTLYQRTGTFPILIDVAELYQCTPAFAVVESISLNPHRHSKTNILTYTMGFFPCGSEIKTSASNVGDPRSIPGSGRSPGEGNGNPLQYSCLENPMDGGAWWATVHGVAKSWTRLNDFTFTFHLWTIEGKSPLGI